MLIGLARKLGLNIQVGIVFKLTLPELAGQRSAFNAGDDELRIVSQKAVQLEHTTGFPHSAMWKGCVWFELYFTRPGIAPAWVTYVQAGLPVRTVSPTLPVLCVVTLRLIATLN